MFRILILLAGFSSIRTLAQAQLLTTSRAAQPVPGSTFGDNGPVLDDVVLADDRSRLGWIVASILATVILNDKWISTHIRKQDTDDSANKQLRYQIYIDGKSTVKDVFVDWQSTYDLHNYVTKDGDPWWHAGYTAAVWRDLESQGRPMEDQAPSLGLRYLTGIDAVNTRVNEGTFQSVFETIRKYAGTSPMIVTSRETASKLKPNVHYALHSIREYQNGIVLSLRDPSVSQLQKYWWDDLKKDILWLSHFTDMEKKLEVKYANSY